METHKYICNYCFEQYIPRRRYVQKYCSNSCRSKAYHRRQVENNKTIDNPDKIDTTITELPLTPIEIITQEKSSIESMSLPGIGNAALGTLAADLIKFFAKGEGNQPATRNDIRTLLSNIGKYHIITNLPKNEFGESPYFDLDTNTIFYF